MVSHDDILSAAQRLQGHARVTPLLSAPLLDRAAGRRVLVKAEALQVTGSFKFRGAWNAVSALDEAARARGVLAFSSGNHAQGIACAAARLGAPSVIVMPANAPALKIDNTRALGGEVVLYDRVGGESREAIGEALAEERGLTLIQPFDHPMVIAGQGTTGLEIAAQVRAEGIEAGPVLICCGGGGLASGMALALEQAAPGCVAHPVEPLGFDDWRRSQASGRREANAHESGSICDAILTPSPGRLTWPIGERLFGPALAVSDRDARRAMAAAARYLKLILEPGGAVALAAALFQPDAAPGESVIAVASGGNVDLADFAAWTAEWHDPDAWTAEGLPL